MKPLLLDAYACAGIGADGYADAFQVVCLDDDPRALAHNPHHVVLGDALRLLADPGFVAQFDAIHASPPCQAFSAARELARAQGKGSSRRTKDLLAPTLALLRGLDVPWIVENVERSPLRDLPHVRLCGSAFGLPIQRHRLFASNVDLGVPPACQHDTFPLDPGTGKPRPWGIYYAMADNIPSGGRTCIDAAHGHACMGVTGRTVPWKYLCEGLPPAYTRWIGSRLAGWCS